MKLVNPSTVQELETDAIFLVLSLVNKDLFIYVFITSVRCEIRYVGTAELKFILYINVRVTSMIQCQKTPGCSD